jgi:hypothetical protein
MTRSPAPRTAAAFLALALGVSLVLAGCAAFRRSEARSAEDVLAAAGFRQLPATTPQRIDALRTMKPRTLSQVTRDGKTYYVYPDPDNCNCLYVGNEGQFQEYKRLALEKEMADERLEAADAEEDTAMDWGVWGPW